MEREISDPVVPDISEVPFPLLDLAIVLALISPSPSRDEPNYRKKKKNQRLDKQANQMIEPPIEFLSLHTIIRKMYMTHMGKILLCFCLVIVASSCQ